VSELIDYIHAVL